MIRPRATPASRTVLSGQLTSRIFYAVSGATVLRIAGDYPAGLLARPTAATALNAGHDLAAGSRPQRHRLNGFGALTWDVTPRAPVRREWVLSLFEFVWRVAGA